MEAFSPEFAQDWLAVNAGAGDDPVDPRSEGSLSPEQQKALEELAERVTAARSVY